MRYPSTFFLLLIFLAESLAGAQSKKLSAPSAPTIAHVTFVSVHSYSKDKLLAATGLKIGEPLTDDSLRAAANRLAQTGAFTDVRYKYNGGDVEFTLPEQTDLAPCRFENIVWFKPDEIDSGVAARVPLYNGSVPGNGNLAESVSRALEGMLREKGIKDPQVEALPLTEMGRGGKLLGMLFSAVRPETKVGQVNFSGVSDAELPALQKGVQQLIGGDYRRGFVSEFMQSNLLGIYHRDGYLRASVDDIEGKLASSTDTSAIVDLTVKVTQRDQFHIGEMRWAGTEVVPKNEAGKFFKLKSNDVANQDLLRASVENFAGAYKAKGYMKARVTAAQAMDADKPIVSYDIDVAPGKQYHMGTITVRGLDAGGTAETEKRWKLKAGEVFDPGYFSNYLSRDLRGLNLRGLEARYEERLNDEPGTVDVVVEFRRASPR